MSAQDLKKIEDSMHEEFADLKDKIKDETLTPRVPPVLRYEENILKNNRPVVKRARQEGVERLWIRVDACLWLARGAWHQSCKRS